MGWNTSPVQIKLLCEEQWENFLPRLWRLPESNREQKTYDRQADGESRTLIIRRLRCCECVRMHHELPDIVIPYKRYNGENIEEVLPPKDNSPSFPCETIIASLLRIWFLLLCDTLKGCSGYWGSCTGGTRIFMKNWKDWSLLTLAQWRTAGWNAFSVSSWIEVAGNRFVLRLLSLNNPVHWPNFERRDQI